MVDVDAFALQNAYEANYGPGPAVVVLLNAGASATNVNIVVERPVALHPRPVAWRQHLHRSGPERTQPAVRGSRGGQEGAPGRGHAFDDVRPVLHAVTENLLLEIQKTFDFYKATAESDQIDRIVLSGGASAVDGFADAIADRFGVAVEHFDPFRQVAFERPPADNIAELAATAAVAVGLALRKAGDR